MFQKKSSLTLLYMVGYNIGNYKKSLLKILTGEDYLKSIFRPDAYLTNIEKKEIIKRFILPGIKKNIGNIKTFADVQTIAKNHRLNISMIRGIATNMTTRSALKTKVACYNLEENIFKKLGPLYWIN